MWEYKQCLQSVLNVVAWDTIFTLNEGHGTPSHDQCGVKLDIDLCRYMLEVFWVQVLSVTFFLPIWG